MGRTSLVIILFLFSPYAFGGLGETEDTCNRDLSPNHKTVQVGNYRVHTITGETGSTLREYATGGGVVFAVAWDGGLRHPDLENFLGKHLGEYKNHISEFKHQSGRRMTHVQTENVVFNIGGHMGHVHGNAYVPSLLPAGVTANDIK